MPSPFPGMDPYLEDPNIWPDFHTTFLVALRAALKAIVPEPYVVRFDRHVWVDEPEEEPRLTGRPDVYVADPLARQDGPEGAAVLAAPAVASLPYPARRGQPFLRILDARNHRVVTAIELLSPSNKAPGKDRDAYLNERADYLASQVNLVEMDLLRAGRRPPVAEPIPPADYYIIVSRAVDFPKAGVWHLGVRDALPAVPVPLGPADAPVHLPLRPSLDRAYDEAGYAQEIDYDRPPVQPLSQADASWARELLASRINPRPHA